MSKSPVTPRWTEEEFRAKLALLTPEQFEIIKLAANLLEAGAIPPDASPEDAVRMLREAIQQDQ